MNYNSAVAGSPPAYEGGCFSKVVSGGTSTCTFALNGGEAVGIWTDWPATATGTAVDSLGNTPVQAITVAAFGAGTTLRFYYIQNATAGTHTLSVTFPANAAYQMAAVAYTGAATTGSLIDGTPTSAIFTTTAGSITCPAITTTQSNGVIIGGALNSSAVTVNTPGTGFTARQHTEPTQTIADMSTGSAGSYAASFTTTATTGSACLSMVFKHV
jgi:hypothetical protein